MSVEAEGRVGVAAVLALSAAVLAFAGAGGLRGFALRLNWSGSLPRGLYVLVPAPAAGPRGPRLPRLLGHGDMVLVCPPAWFAALALARRYLPPGSCPGGTQPLGKLVLAVGGDRLDVRRGGILLNGRRLDHTASAAADAAGRMLPRLGGPEGEREVAAGQVWLVAPHPRSLDSRYFGPVGAADLQGRLVPLLVEGGAGGAAAAAMARAIRGAAGPG